MTAEVQKAIADLNKVEKTTGKANDGFKSFAKSIAGYSTGMNLAVDVTKKIISGVADLAKESITLAASFEKSRISWGVLMGDVSQGNAMFDELMQFAAQTPLAFESINKAATTLKGFGVEADDLIPTMEKLGDVSMGNNETLSQLALVFGQVKAQGKAMTQDLYQFVNAGVPIFQLLADTMGVTTGEVKDLASQSKISFDEIEKAVTAATSEGGLFFGMMDKTADSTAGKWSTAQDNFKQGLAELGNDFLPLVNAALDTFNKRVAESARLGGISKAISGGAASIEETTSAIAVLTTYIDTNKNSTNGYIKQGVELAKQELNRLNARLDILKQLKDQDDDIAAKREKNAAAEKKADEQKAKDAKAALKSKEDEELAADEAAEAYERYWKGVIRVTKAEEELYDGTEGIVDLLRDIGNEVDQVSDAWSEWTVQIGETEMSLKDLKESGSMVWDSVSAAYQSYLDLQENGSDAVIAGLEAQRDAMKENGQDTVAIDAQIKAKKNEAAEKQFNANKLTSLADIAINTAVAISKTMATPWLAAAVAGLGIVQAGNVAAQQYVPFASGGYVDQPTHALIGEAGGEWILNKAQMAGLAKSGIGGGGVTIVQNIGGSVWTSKGLESLAVSAVAKAGRGF